MAKVKVELVKYDMDKTKKRKRKNLLVDAKNEQAVVDQLERIHKGEKVDTIHEIIWDEEQIKESRQQDREKENEIFTGEVKFFDPEKGFGFIMADEDIDDLFFHASAVSGDEARDRDRVEFEIGRGPKGPCAIHIKVIY